MLLNTQVRLSRSEFPDGESIKMVLSRTYFQSKPVQTVLIATMITGAIPLATAQDTDSAGLLEEVIVTATKRETNLMETATAISVISASEIVNRKIVGMEDYLAGMPGVSYQDRGGSSNTITIRGIALGSQLDPNSPTGTYFGEIPLVGLGSSVNGNQAGNPDIKMVDIQRVEVLRGPQGTLYGSGAMGGLVRIIPNAPNLQEVEGTLAAEASNTAENGGFNYMAQAVVSAPFVEDKLAVRLVAYQFDNEGWIDNVAGSHPNPGVAAAAAMGAVAIDRPGTSDDTYSGLRASILWQPTDNFSANLSHIFQNIDQDGYREVELTRPGKFSQSRARVGTRGSRDEYVEIDLNATNLVLEYGQEWGDFFNSTSYVTNDVENDFDISFLGTGLGAFLGTGSLNTRETDLFTNEFRFVSNLGGPLQYLAGLYYEDRSLDSTQRIRWTGNPPEPAGTFNNNARSVFDTTQTAVFGELSYNITDPLTLTVGARYFNFDMSIPVATSFGVPTAQQGIDESVDDSTFKVNLSYQINDQYFVYGQWSQGFREPKLQGLILPEMDADGDGLVEFVDGIERDPPEGLLAPDTVDNYEIGLKYQSNDGRLAGSLTGFYIDWAGIPIVPSLTQFLGAALWFNAGQAESSGIEFETSIGLTDDLLMQLSASWVDSVLTESAPGLGVEGDDLPGSADFNARVSLEQQFDLGNYPAFVRGDYTYVGEYYSQFTETGIAAGDYHVFDLNSGVSFGNMEISVFAKNMLNADDFTWVDNVFGTDRAYRLRPRTIGINFRLNYQ
jgi:iron complex outermembrane receptor protein